MSYPERRISAQILLLLNGGAAVAVLALIGHLSTSATTAAQVNKFAVPLLFFGWGLLFVAMASGGPV